MIQLYPYQEKGINEVRESYRNNVRTLLVAPTGSGKTVMFSYIAAAATQRGKRVLILTDRTELFKQTITAMSRHQIPVCKIDPDTKYADPNALLFIGMVETFKRRISTLQHITFDLIICDEAHKKSFIRVYNAYPTVHTLGCTATPIGDHLYKYYSHMVQTIDVPELIKQGFLSPCRGYEMQDDFSDLKTDSSGEYTDQSQLAHFSTSKLYDGLINEYLKRCTDRKTLVFCVNIEHVKQTVKAFVSVGIKAYGIHSKTPDHERAWILGQFKIRRDIVVVNANILIAGFDEPSIDCIMVNRATASLAAWHQMIGRGSRICNGKRDFIVVDFGGNFSRLGLWDEPRTWTLAPPKKRRKTLGAAPVKSCKQCGAMVLAVTRKCEFCGYQWPMTEKELAQGRLVEVANQTRDGMSGKKLSECSVRELIELEKAGVNKASYTWRLLRARGEAALTEYAQIKEYRHEWIFRQLEVMEAELRDDGKVKFNDKTIGQVPLIQI